jgi:hypothetical protein
LVSSKNLETNLPAEFLVEPKSGFFTPSNTKDAARVLTAVP